MVNKINPWFKKTYGINIKSKDLINPTSDPYRINFFEQKIIFLRQSLDQVDP